MIMRQTDREIKNQIYNQIMHQWENTKKEEVYKTNTIDA